MNLSNVIKYTNPFLHWELNNCFNSETIDEISYSNTPSGTRSYDGTRAADHTGNGLDGKLRLFITKKNSNFFPNLTKVINSLQDKEIVNKISTILNKDLSSSFLRLEIIADKKGFWLKPHKDISEKLMTMMIWANTMNLKNLVQIFMIIISKLSKQ